MDITIRDGDDAFEARALELQMEDETLAESREDLAREIVYDWFCWLLCSVVGECVPEEDHCGMIEHRLCAYCGRRMPFARMEHDGPLYPFKVIIGMLRERQRIPERRSA